jgi:hypothetical protein
MMLAALSALAVLAAGFAVVLAVRRRRQAVQPARLLRGLGAVSPQWVMLHRPDER